MKQKPVHVARIEKVRITVGRNGPGRFTIYWRPYIGAARLREHFTSRQDAIARANELARAIANGQADVVTFTNADRDHYRLAVQALQPLGIPLPVAIAEYTAAKRLNPQHTLLEVGTFFQRGHAERHACPPTAQVVAELLADIADNRRDPDYHATVARDLAPFAARFPDMQAVTHADLKAYLSARTILIGPRKGQPIGLRRRDNIRDTIVLLYRYARRPRGGQDRAYLPDRPSIAEQIPRLSIGGEVSTWSPQELDAILSYFATHDPMWLPWAAIGAFAGLRSSSEIFRIDWSHVHWETNTIAVPASIARKIRIARRAPLLPNLAAWLAPWRHATGPVVAWPGKDAHHARFRALVRLRKALGWKTWKSNALRHSFGSNRLAIVRDIHQVALEMGNSPAQIREHYNDSTPASEAEKYFALTPATPPNILPLVAAR